MVSFVKALNVKSVIFGTLFLIIIIYSYTLCRDRNLRNIDIPIKSPEKIYNYHLNSLRENGCLINCNDQIDLYIDYSTCVAKAEELLTKPEGQATFYHDIRPKIIDCNPDFYSIKGEIIKKEEGSLYNLLRSVTEINYADIKTAVEKIVNNGNQAILITDGEYYEKGFAADHYNNPYLAESFKSWLRKGNEIYILSEPYTEQGLYDKYRYYMIFTNQSIDEDKHVFKKLYSTVEAYKPKLPCTHITISGLKLINEYVLSDDSRVNINLISQGAYEKENMEYHYPQIYWKDIWKYIKNGSDISTGQPLPFGEFVFKGFKVDNSDVKYHHITKLRLKVTNVYEEFREFEGVNFDYSTTAPFEINNVFKIDQEHFKATKEVLIRVHENFTGDGLNHDDGYRLVNNNYSCDPDSLIKENLLRIDILIDKTEVTFNQHPEDFDSFKWYSISSKHKGAINESVFQSIKNAIEDPSITPKIINNGVLHTIYLRTFPSDL